MFGGRILRAYGVMLATGTSGVPQEPAERTNRLRSFGTSDDPANLDRAKTFAAWAIKHKMGYDRVLITADNHGGDDAYTVYTYHADGRVESSYDKGVLNGEPEPPPPQPTADPKDDQGG